MEQLTPKFSFAIATLLSLAIPQAMANPLVGQASGPAIAPPLQTAVTQIPLSATPQPKLAAAPDLKQYQDYQRVIQDTVSMVSDPKAQSLAQRHGLNILNVTWEDTGRYYDSAVGPNISDMSIQVQQQNPETGQYTLNLMPVIRHPNFSDRSADIDPDSFLLPVGNERGEALKQVTLTEFLGNMRRYLHDPDSWLSRQNSFLADRDSHVLVSAQASFLPIPKDGIAEFNPVLFNYQSYEGDPAVLTILATREGTSVTIIDNKRDGFEAGQTWGQRLFFNQNGERASLTGQRLSDFVQASDGPTNPELTVEAKEEDGLNMVLLIQVPLKQKQPLRSSDFGAVLETPMADAVPSAMQRSDVEAAVIGHGEVEGPFTEIDGLDIERDPKFPVRVTVQFYKATSNGVVSEQDMQEIKDQIARVYEDADYVGSLVTEGMMGRPTEYEGPHQEPQGWWDAFWKRHEENTNMSREEAKKLLQKLRNQD